MASKSFMLITSSGNLGIWNMKMYCEGGWYTSAIDIETNNRLLFNYQEHAENAWGERVRNVLQYLGYWFV